MRLLIAALATALAVAAPVAACGVAAVCGDIADAGGVIVVIGVAPLVEFEWSTDAEAPPVMAYRLDRCDGTGCQWIATVRAAGTCGAEQRYGVIDQPPALPTRYRLSVLTASGSVMCPVEVPIE